MNNLNIINCAEINNGKVYVNAQIKHTLDRHFTIISKELYRIYCKGYGKFFKMDSLSKLGFLTCEILLKDANINNFNPSEVALVMGNSKSSLSTDIKYYETTNAIASPALFVYTLPNIVMGEICIKNGFKGENLFFVSEEYNENELNENIDIILKNSSTQYVIAGWIDFIDEENYKSVLYLIYRNYSAAKIKATDYTD